MKIKYNFGLLKNQMVGFIRPDTGEGYHGELKNVIKRGCNYRFVYESQYIEISELVFASCRLERLNDIYYLIPDNCVNGLIVYSMYDIFGFPPELTQEILEEKGFHVDTNGFLLIKEIQKQKNKGTYKNPNAF